jgi:hypothetical protein
MQYCSYKYYQYNFHTDGNCVYYLVVNMYHMMLKESTSDTCTV